MSDVADAFALLEFSNTLNCFIGIFQHRHRKPTLFPTHPSCANVSGYTTRVGETYAQYFTKKYT